MSIFRNEKAIRWVANTLIGVLCILGIYLFFAFLYAPRDRIRVSIANLPRDTYFACMVAKGNDGIQFMDWFHGAPPPGWPIRSHPVQSSWSYHDFGVPEAEGLYVDWVWSERYGILVRTKTGKWMVKWFEADAIPILGRESFWGGGEILFDFTQGDAVLLNDAEVQELGIEGQMPVYRKR